MKLLALHIIFFFFFLPYFHLVSESKVSVTLLEPSQGTAEKTEVSTMSKKPLTYI